jgi:hypothetical protein
MTYAAAGLVVAATFAAASPKARSLLFPAARVPLVEVHPAHQKSKIDCDRCHAKAKSSAWASERLSPRMPNCEPCHAEVKGVTAATPVNPTCRKCHGALANDRPPVPGFYPQPLVRFSHKAHGTSSCASCHQGSSDTAAAPSMPTMRQCYDCHKKRRGAADCRRCHLAQGDGRLNTRLSGAVLLPPTWLLGPNHGSGWAGDHAITAGSRSSLCGACHGEKFCSECHSGARRPRNLHPGDWLRTHGTATRFDNPHCQGCHRTQSFCLTCHRRAGVATDSPAATMPKQGAGRTHGTTPVSELMRRGKKNITACVACHTESSCIDCHSIVNPHPASWQHRCSKIAPRAESACRKCHVEGADRCR